MFGRILVALDGSPFAEFALPSAIAVARSAGAELRLLRVVQRPAVPAFSEDSDPDRIEAKTYLNTVAERICLNCPASISVAVREGPVAPALESEAAEWGAEVIVMSTHGRAGLSRIWTGSVAARCVEAGYCPVLLVRPPAEGVPDLNRLPRVARIVVPLDGSELAERAIDPAVELARACRVHVLLLHILPTTGAGRLELAPGSEQEREERRVRERCDMKDYLKRQVARVRRAGAHAYAMLLSEPHPAESIADRVEGDLIVMATHGHARLDRALLGSLTDRVVRAAACPVMVVPPAPAPEGAVRRQASAAHR